jgi:RND family efflux transporter MFP subunit
MTTSFISAITLSALLLAGCARGEQPEARPETVSAVGTVYTVRDTVIATTFDASGVAEPIQRATLSTKLMGTITSVLVKEGDVVGAGQILARIDARDLAAKDAQVAASLAEAQAVRRDAETQAGRMRALYVDSAATRVQLDAAETGLARADATVRTAHAAADELHAVSAYATIRAPFAGTVTRRFVDPGAFATPGSPIMVLEDATRLRVRANVVPALARGIARAQRMEVTLEGTNASAVVEGVVPVSGNLHAVNVIVANRDGVFLAGSAATLSIPSGSHRALLIPIGALHREGDLTGVMLRTTTGDAIRWVRVTRLFGDFAEIGSGLVAGDQVVVPRSPDLPVSEGGR